MTDTRTHRLQGNQCECGSGTWVNRPVFTEFNGTVKCSDSDTLIGRLVDGQLVTV